MENQHIENTHWRPSLSKKRYFKNLPIQGLLIILAIFSMLIPATGLFFRLRYLSSELIEKIYRDNLPHSIQSIAKTRDTSLTDLYESLEESTSHWQRDYQYTLFMLDIDTNEVQGTSSHNLGSSHPFSLPRKLLHTLSSSDTPQSIIYNDDYRGRMILVHTKVGNSSYMLAIFPVKQFAHLMRSHTLSIAFFMVLIACILIASFMIIYRYINRPVLDLLGCVRSQSVPRAIEPYLEWNNEIGRLCYAYYARETMYASNLAEISRLNEERRESELEILQNQINSHFIYNTLNNIQWLAQAGRTHDVIATVQALDHLLRCLAITDGDMVSIEEEISYCEAYLTAQKIRFEDLFTFNFVADPLLLQMKIPKFILQPLVENSIYHGFIDGNRQIGHIEIQVSRRGHRIDIMVEDDGIGIESGRIKEVLRNTHKSSDRYMGVAIGNINRRIKLLCGREYGLGIDSMKGQYTKVQITVPISLQ